MTNVIVFRSATLVLMVALMFMAMAAIALAAPGENSPWEPVDVNGDTIPDPCDHPSPGGQFDGELYHNTNSGKTHCFKP